MVTDNERRATSYGPSEQLLLKTWGRFVLEAWGERAYVVGSSQKGERFPRDIDVRVMIETNAFTALFGDWREDEVHRDPHRNPKWLAHMLAWSEFGRRMTGLPIDFQVQTLNEANSRWPRDPRNPL